MAALHCERAMRFIAFVNRASGGNEGTSVIAFLSKSLGGENVFDLKADGGPDRGLDLHAADPSQEVRVFVAGGDGTFSWVASAVDRRGMTHVRLLVIPLGSGNDMSRALGWGKKFPGMDRMQKFVHWAQDVTTPAQYVDVWRLKAAVHPDKDGLSTNIDTDGVTHGIRPLVCNYLSLGADAHVELHFNRRRWDAPEKYKSRLGNFRAHVVVGTKYMIRESKIRVVDHVESLTVDNRPIPIPKNLQALIFLNIPSYGAGTQPWGFPGKGRSMFVNDKKFEVIGLKSLNHFSLIKVMAVPGVRIAQGSSMKIVLKGSSTPFQVDGEPWEQHGGVITLEPGNPVGVLQGPEYRAKSRKNAKFSAAIIPERPLDDSGVAISSPGIPVVTEIVEDERPTASFG